ncbi:MAG TPA: response regulator transcription factor [Acidobacteriaceae bacterium]|nr:response regulator transcription factor [Acidobacteriaceae bacterium]
MRVLVVEDDRALGDFLLRGMEREGHRVQWAMDGDDAIEQAGADHPDLILLDLSLPRRDGVEVLAELRKLHLDAAVLVLSGRNDLNARVECLDMGADDYLLKPFSFAELTARCRALLRRRTQAADPALRCGDLELNRIEHKVTRGGRAISLTAKEFSLLEYLLLHEGECVSRSQLLADVWQMPEQTGTNVVDVYVNYLRRKVDAAAGPDDAESEYGASIETIRGSGYRLACGVRKPAERKPPARALGRSRPAAGVAFA